MAETGQTLRLEAGCSIYIRYVDASLFRRADPGRYRPVVLEMRGWLDFEDNEHYRILWEKPVQPIPPGMDPEASGISIPKTHVLEIRRED